MLGLEKEAEDKWQAVSGKVKAITGTKPDIFSIIAYDIISTMET